MEPMPAWWRSCGASWNVMHTRIWVAPLLCVAACLAAPARAADDHMKMVLKGRFEAEQLWRRGFTLGDSAFDATLQGMLDTLVAGEMRPPGVELRVRVLRAPENNA